MTTNLIGARIKALREERKLSQDDLARLFGFKDRQTVSAIETGERRVSAEELVMAVEKLGAPLDYFTDPFLLVGEGRFSWRQTDVGRSACRAYERSAGRWIAAFRAIAPQVGHASAAAAARARAHTPSALRGCHGSGRALRRRIRARRRAGGAAGRGDGAGARHSGAAWSMRSMASPARPAACRNSMPC